MKLITLLVIAVLAVLAVLASPAHADLHPGYHALNPAICTPPLPPAEGSPGWTINNPFSTGVYWDPISGMWYVPDGMWQGESGARMIEVIEEIEVLTYQTWPSWATSDAWEGRYWYPGGFYANTGRYYAEGYYFPSEIW